jgi:hypothetical protein
MTPIFQNSHVHKSLQHALILPGACVLAERCLMQVPIHVVQSRYSDALELQVSVQSLTLVGMNAQPAPSELVGMPSRAASASSSMFTRW